LNTFNTSGLILSQVVAIMKYFLTLKNLLDNFHAPARVVFEVSQYKILIIFNMFEYRPCVTQRNVTFCSKVLFYILFESFVLHFVRKFCSTLLSNEIRKTKTQNISIIAVNQCFSALVIPLSSIEYPGTQLGGVVKVEL